MTEAANTLRAAWQFRLSVDYPQQKKEQQGIVSWLLGEDWQRFEYLSPATRAIAYQHLDYRYGILRQRYLDVEPKIAYSRLVQRLRALVIPPRMKSWAAHSCERQQEVAALIYKTISTVLLEASYIKKQKAWIEQCTSSFSLRNALLLASLEEYALQPIGNRPRIVYCTLAVLQQQKQASKDLFCLLSEEMNLAEIDIQAISKQETLDWEQQQTQRIALQQAFERYLTAEVGELATRWLRLHLQGHPQRAIAATLHLTEQQIARLQEEVYHHARQWFNSF